MVVDGMNVIILESVKIFMDLINIYNMLGEILMSFINFLLK
jgi:hypothetical protein